MDQANGTPERLRVDKKRIAIFLAFAFGISWAFGLAVYLTGGMQKSPILIPHTGITLALALIAVGYMWGPAAAHFLTRKITREGWSHTLINPSRRKSWPYWVMGWLMPAVLTVVGIVIFFLIFPKAFDGSLDMIKVMIKRHEMLTGHPVGYSPGMVVALQVIQALTFAPIINSLFTFGEEFGWRAYLLPKFMPMGGRKAVLIVGVIWGVWHWPVIAMGHNYGLSYPGAPWLGMLLMVWCTMIYGVFLGWLVIRGGSVWPAVLGHASINAIAGLGLIFMQGRINPLLGPSAAGLIGSAGFTILAVILLLIPAAWKPVSPDVVSGLPAAPAGGESPAALEG